MTYTTKAEQFSLRLRRAPEPNQANTTVEVTTRVFPLLHRIPVVGRSLFDLTDTNLGFFFQYFNGYGNELVDFDEKDEIFRIGLRFL